MFIETEIEKSEFGFPNYQGSIIGRGFRVLNLNWAQKVSLHEMNLSTLHNCPTSGVRPPQEPERQEDAGGEHAADPDVRRNPVSGNASGRDAASLLASQRG